MLNKSDDSNKALKPEIQKIVVGLVFIAVVPVAILNFAAVDITQGCVVVTDNDVGNKYKERNPDYGVQGAATADQRFLEKQYADTDVGFCKVFTETGAVGETFEGLQVYGSMGIVALFLVIGLVSAIGPGIALAKYRLR